MTVSPDLAPGCFGMSLAYNVDAMECKTCPFIAACAPKAEASLAAIRAEFGIKVTPKKPKVETPTPVHPIPVPFNPVPEKVQRMMDILARKGVRVTESLCKGINPFPVAPAFLRVTCHLLLGLPQGISRDLLRQALQKHLGWDSKEHAASHALRAVQLLQALGAADEQNGIIRLRKS